MSSLWSPKNDIRPIIWLNSNTLSWLLFSLPIDRLTSESHFPRGWSRTKSNLSSETRQQAGSILDPMESDYQFETQAASREKRRSSQVAKPSSCRCPHGAGDGMRTVPGGRFRHLTVTGWPAIAKATRQDRAGARAEAFRPYGSWVEAGPGRELPARTEQGYRRLEVGEAAGGVIEAGSGVDEAGYLSSLGDRSRSTGHEGPVFSLV